MNCKKNCRSIKEKWKTYWKILYLFANLNKRWPYNNLTRYGKPCISLRKERQTTDTEAPESRASRLLVPHCACKLNWKPYLMLYAENTSGDISSNNSLSVKTQPVKLPCSKLTNPLSLSFSYYVDRRQCTIREKSFHS